MPSSTRAPKNWRQLRKSVGPEECGEQVTHVRDRKTEVVADQRIGHRKRRTVDVVDDTGDDEERQRDALNGFETRRCKFRCCQFRRRKLGGGHASSPLLFCWRET